jgi:hypothetical protein
MSVNFLEQLLAEWYELQGYFIRRNVWVGKRARGGYECELDVVGFHPERKHLVQIEPSMDADSWAIREKRFHNKFEAGRKYIPSLFRGMHVPDTVEQIAVLVFAGKKDRSTLAGGKLVLIQEARGDILRDLRGRSINRDMVPEQMPIIRTLQFVAEYRKLVCSVLMSKEP